MTNKLKMLGLAAVMAVASTAASAATVVSSFGFLAPTVSAGEGSALGVNFSASAGGYDAIDVDYGLTATSNYKGVAIAGFNESTVVGGGDPIVVSYWIDAGPATVLSFSGVPTSDSAFSFSLLAGQTLYIGLEGTPAEGGVFDVTVSSVPVPAAGFLLIGGLGALAATRRRKKS
ncbi:VPLPA-CTERM sorting domain-containing protein [Pseudooceanicola sp.]|uniref:VPLPA-CTERM sorting domain-containing protein n=1 Tax=Pseudooceanicola sp. TaxID=1914328 RepID=UPI0035C6C782